MPNKITVETIREIAEELQGTTGSLDVALEERGLEIDDIPPELLRELDEAVILCETCGWWCESSEMNEEGVCKDCREEEP